MTIPNPQTRPAKSIRSATETVLPGIRRSARRHRALGCAIWLVLCAACVGAARADTQNGYALGEGYQIPGTDWHLGGYATASVTDPEGDPPRVAVDNLSLFLWWQSEGRWKFFSEFEYENPLSNRSDRLSSDDYFSWERAYLEYALTDSTSIRAGKFLTPIGRWNLIHATPLVWTTSRPLVTTLPFPTNMTGLMVTTTIPSLARGVEVSFYGAGAGEIRPNPDIDPFSSALGTHVTLSLSGESQIGFSYVDFEQEKSRPERKQLVGVDGLWTHDRFELSAEAVYRSSNSGGALDERGAYMQLVAPLSERLYAVGRYETFKRSNDERATEMWVTGLNFRITSAWVFKAEWVAARHNTLHAPDGFLASISVLL